MSKRIVLLCATALVGCATVAPPSTLIMRSEPERIVTCKPTALGATALTLFGLVGVTGSVAAVADAPNVKTGIVMGATTLAVFSLVGFLGKSLTECRDGESDG
jgi:hypothetical protein